MYLLYIVLVICFRSVRGDVRNCDNFYPSNYKSNCTLVCGLRLQRPPVENETALCVRGSSTPIVCTSHKDCGRNLAAYCKSVPCFCDTEPQFHPYYFYHPALPQMSICVIPTSWTHPDMPLIPFPWLTLIVVLGILLFFGLCLVVLRWMSPYIRRMQAKREATDGDTGGSPDNAEASALFSSVLQSGSSQRSQSCSAFRTSQGSHRPSSSRRFRSGRYAHWDRLDILSLPTSCAVAEDKPPPYEVAIQMQLTSSGDEVQENLECDTVPAIDANDSRGTESHGRPIESSLS